MNEQDRSKPVEAAVELAVPAPEVPQIEGLFQQYSAMVFRAAFRVAGNAADAEDVLQTVFLRLVRHPDGIGEVSGLEGYLYRAAVNAALDLVRARRRSPDVPLDAAPSANGADTRFAPDRAHRSAEIRDWLREAIGRLHPTAAEIFVLRFFENKGNAEIAALLGTTPGTVAVTLHRARTKIQAEYQAYQGGAK